MIRLVLVRHGQTAWNAQKRYQGQSDVPMDETGLAQAKALAAHFADDKPDAIYSSDLQRARDTAEVIARAAGLRFTRDPRLRECSYGRWEAMTYKEIQERWPEDYTAWQHDPLTRFPPGGESLDQLTERVGSFVSELHNTHAEQKIMIVAHGGSLRALICYAMKLPSHTYWRLSLATGSVSELLLHSETAVLTLFNDQHYVSSIPSSPWVGRADGLGVP
jgi:alpha-ribazole phosphatase